MSIGRSLFNGQTKKLPFFPLLFKYMTLSTSPHMNHVTSVIGAPNTKVRVQGGGGGWGGGKKNNASLVDDGTHNWQCSLLYSLKFVLFWITNERVGHQKSKCCASFHFLCAFPGRNAFPSSAAFRILPNNKMLNKSMNLAPSIYEVSCISKATSANSGKNCGNHYFA